MVFLAQCKVVEFPLTYQYSHVGALRFWQEPILDLPDGGTEREAAHADLECRVAAGIAAESVVAPTVAEATAIAVILSG